MKLRTHHARGNSRPGITRFFQEMAIAVLLGLGLGIICNDLFLGLALGMVYGLANCLSPG